MSDNGTKSAKRQAARARGFTLIELLVVIAILALLAALLVPTVSKAKRSGMASKCIANHKQVATGIQLYMDENESYFPALKYASGVTGLPALPAASEPRVIADNGALWWPDAIFRYLSDGRILTCSESKEEATRAAGGMKESSRLGIGLNHTNIGVVISGGGNANQRQRVSAVAQPGATVMLADSGMLASGSVTDPLKWTGASGGATVYFTAPAGTAGSSVPAAWAIPRHGDGQIVVTYVDLHAAKIKNNEWGYTAPAGDGSAQWDLN